MINKTGFFKGFSLGVVMLLCLGLISCSPEKDLSLIQNNTCVPPCWNGISPGSTTGEEVLSKLNALSVVKHETVKTGTAPHLFFKDVIFGDFVETGSGVIYLSDNTVTQIDFLNVNYSLRELISLYGDPDEVIFYPYNGKAWKVNVIYREKGLWFYYTKKQAENWMIDIQPTDQITTVSFVDPSRLDDVLLNSGALFIKDEKWKFEDVQQPWEGYGEMSIILGD